MTGDNLVWLGSSVFCFTIHAGMGSVNKISGREVGRMARYSPQGIIKRLWTWHPHALKLVFKTLRSIFYWYVVGRMS